MCAARVWPRTPMTASGRWMTRRGTCVGDGRPSSDAASGAAPTDCLRGRRVMRTPEASHRDGLVCQIVGWPGQSGYQRRSGGLDSGTSARRVGRLGGGGRGRGDRGPAGRRRCGRRRRPRRPRAHAPARHRVARQGPAHRGRPRAGGPGARDGGPFAGRAGQAASLRGGHGAQPGRDDGREERPGPQSVAPAGGHRGGRVPGRRRAAPRGAGDGRRRAGPAAGG